MMLAQEGGPRAALKKAVQKRADKKERFRNRFRVLFFLINFGLVGRIVLLVSGGSYQLDSKG